MPCEFSHHVLFFRLSVYCYVIVSVYFTGNVIRGGPELLLKCLSGIVFLVLCTVVMQCKFIV